MVGRLILFYVGAIVVLIGIVPWNRIQPGSDVTASPFVKVFQLIGVPAAAHVVNFVVITAAASSMNCNLYLVSRMMFSLARGGYAPASFGRVSSRRDAGGRVVRLSRGLALALVIALAVSRWRLRLLIRDLPVRRIVRMADDLHYSSLFPSEVGRIGPPTLACSHDRIPIYVAARNGRDHRNYRDHVVDRGDADNDRCRIAVAGRADSRLFLGATPTADQG